MVPELPENDFLAGCGMAGMVLDPQKRFGGTGVPDPKHDSFEGVDEPRCEKISFGRGGGCPGLKAKLVYGVQWVFWEPQKTVFEETGPRPLKNRFSGVQEGIRTPGNSCSGVRRGWCRIQNKLVLGECVWNATGHPQRYCFFGAEGSK